MENVINIRDYGDSKEGLKQAINEVRNTGKPLYFPAGEYDLGFSEELYNNLDKLAKTNPNANEIHQCFNINNKSFKFIISKNIYTPIKDMWVVNVYGIEDNYPLHTYKDSWNNTLFNWQDNYKQLLIHMVEEDKRTDINNNRDINVILENTFYQAVGKLYLITDIDADCKIELTISSIKYDIIILNDTIIVYHSSSPIEILTININEYYKEELNEEVKQQFIDTIRKFHFNYILIK